MKFLDEQFRELEEELKITDKSKDQLRSKILQNTHENKKRSFKYYGWITVVICMLFLITSPFYSPTMASMLGKILPISIAPSFPGGQHNPGLTSQLFELVEKEGYTVNSVGITPSPYTIEISLILQGSILRQATSDLEPKITNYLYENGYDEYELRFSEATEVLPDDQEDKTSILYDKVGEIVKEVFASYGYAEEADYELAGLKKSWFSNIVTIDMPDHVQESTEIISDIEKEIKSQNLDVKDIEVNTFNLEHRKQDDRWAYIASDIYDAMAGKSTYQLTGVSYKVKKGHSYVSIKTDLDKPPSEELTQEIELAIQEYLALPETQEQIQNDNYTIQLLLKNEKSLVKITN
jgi:predicted amino acid-binding ACT domain protein